MISHFARRRHTALFGFSRLAKGDSATAISTLLQNKTQTLVITEESTSHTIPQQLTPEDKKQLRLFTPIGLFDDRLSVAKQGEYLPTVTTELYEMQARLFSPQVRIAESNIASDLNKYCNLIYKDIYARFLISKGVGVEWQGRYSQFGVVNPKEEKGSSSPYGLFITALEQGKMFVSKTPTLLSLDSGEERYVEDCNFEFVKRIGHYVLFPIVKYGKYKQQFQALERRRAKVFLVGFVSEPWKSTQAQAISLVSKLKYVILRNTVSDDYYITSAEHFENARLDFNKHQFVRHEVVDSLHLEGMWVENTLGKRIPIIFEETRKGRGSEIHPVCPAHSMGDHDIAKQHQLEITSTVSEDGYLQLSFDDEPMRLDDKDLNQTVREYLKEKGLLLQNFNDVIEDTLVVGPNSELLHLVLTEKLFLRVTQEERTLVLDDFKTKGFVEESKVTLPKVTQPLKGKQRRIFEKQYGEMKQQETDYYSLEESLKLSQMVISTTSDTSSPVMVNLRKNKVVASSSNLSRMKQLDQDQTLDLQAFQSFKEPFSQQKVFYLSQSWRKSAQILSSSNPDLKVVAIQPQSSTEGLFQYCLHIMAALRLPFAFSMIKLHPTLKESVQSLDMLTLIKGAVKSNNLSQYGWGYQTIRMWLAKVDSNKGDRDLIENQVNLEQPNCHSIRKTFWRVLPLLNNVSPKRLSQIKCQTSQIPWFDRFMLDHIDYFVLHMHKAYTRLDLASVYNLSLEFFKSYIEEIYLKSVRRDLITYYKEDSKLIVLERILQLVGVVAPLLPFTAYHVSNMKMPRWPTVQAPTFDKIQHYNKLISYRTLLRNKLSINRMKSCSVYIEGVEGIPEDQMALFLCVNEVVYEDPNRQCRFTMKNALFHTVVYQYEGCFRCDPEGGNRKHLCKVCEEYLGL